MKTHIAYPGVIVANDGDTHLISFMRLCELYKVSPAACVDGSRESEWRGRDVSHLIPIRPRLDGRYPCFMPNDKTEPAGGQRHEKGQS